MSMNFKFSRGCGECRGFIQREVAGIATPIQQTWCWSSSGQPRWVWGKTP